VIVVGVRDTAAKDRSGRYNVRALRVAFCLLTLFPGRVGGSESYVRGLLGALGALGAPEHVTVLANRHVTGPFAGYAGGNVELVHVGSYRPGDGTATRALAMAWAGLAPRAVARDVPRGFDVVHYPVTVPIPRVRAPSLLTLFDVQHLEQPEFVSRAERRYRAVAYDRAARRADLVVSVSEHGRAAAIERLGLDPARVEAVPMGVDLARFGPEPQERDAELRRAVGAPPRYVLYPANLWPHKNHARLLEGFARVRDRDVALVLTGQPYGRLGELMRHAAGSGIADRVHHLGHVPAAALPALYRGAAGMVFPSLYEGFGSPPLEAMACGCPVASSLVASLREVCGDAALGFDPLDPDAIAAGIDRLLCDESLRVRLRTAGLARAPQWTWERAAERHVALYRRLAASTATSASYAR
jgi:glycosyltransferase involved in cell wall biosynthesis